jgi:hypothetical protein
MKPIQSLVVAALATAGLAMAADAQADRGGRSGMSGAHAGGGGNWRGGGGNWRGGGHWGGGYRGWYGPRLGLYIGAPLLWSSWYWGYPYDYYYPRAVVYDRVIERYPASYPDGVMAPADETTEVPRSEGAPARGPTYMNFCESARAYYPKVTSCPEGWKFLPSR